MLNTLPIGTEKVGLGVQHVQYDSNPIQSNPDISISSLNLQKQDTNWLLDWL